MSDLESGRVEQVYGCRQSHLYRGLILCWDAYLEFQSQFESKSTIYTMVYGNASRAAVLEAESLPDFQERDKMHEMIRTRLLPAGGRCVVIWKELEGHIYKSFPESEHKTCLEAAGYLYYRKALRENWSDVSALMKSAVNFITENAATLTTGGMPAGFPAVFGAIRTDFEALFEEFVIAEQHTKDICDAKITANNTVYRATMAMCKDGQKIFRYDAAKRERFVWSRVLRLVGGGEGSSNL